MATYTWQHRSRPRTARQPSPPHRRLSAASRPVVAVVVWFAVLSGLLLLAPRGVAASGGSQAPWDWPVQPLPAVDRAFERPATRYAAGHRGIDLAATAGQSVVAVADGVVTHSGVVAGRGTVTVLHSDGLASTYEPVDERIATGAAVAAGTALGRIGSGSHCAAHTCLHLGARLGEEYLDPLLLLTRVRIVLLPLLPEAARPSGA